MTANDLRTPLVRILEWEDAHVNFDRAVADIAPEHRGTVPPGFAWSLWQLVEHIRLAQADILDFCGNDAYVEPSSMSAYWPSSSTPPSLKHWDDAIASVRRDRAALQALARDESIDLLARVPAGNGQTFLRELLLVADHTAYHVGQVVAVRRALGIWKG